MWSVCKWEIRKTTIPHVLTEAQRSSSKFWRTVTSPNILFSQYAPGVLLMTCHNPNGIIWQNSEKNYRDEEPWARSVTDGGCLPPVLSPARSNITPARFSSAATDAFYQSKNIASGAEPCKNLLRAYNQTISHFQRWPWRDRPVW